MVAIAATPNQTLGTVTLNVTAATGNVTITRTDSTDGVSVIVRGAYNAPVTGGNFTTSDQDCPLNRSVTYTVSDTATNASVIVTLPAPENQDGWLSHPAYSASAIPVTILTDDIRRTGRSVRHDVLGKSAPVFTGQTATLYEGTLTVGVPTREAADDVFLLIGTGDPILLRGPSEDVVRDRWMQITDLTETKIFPATATRQLAIGYVETDGPEPTGSAVQSWTFENVDDTYALFQNVDQGFTTFARLDIGPVS